MCYENGSGPEKCNLQFLEFGCERGSSTVGVEIDICENYVRAAAGNVCAESKEHERRVKE